MIATDLNGLSVTELLGLQSSIMEELNKRKVLRSRNNPTGDYAEYLAAKHLGLSLETNSKSGFDATDLHGNRIQIKGRQVTSKNPSRQLGVIRDLKKNKFDFLVGIVFNESYSIDHAVKIPHEVIGDYATFSAHQNGHILYLSGPILQDKRVQTIGAQFAV